MPPRRIVQPVFIVAGPRSGGSLLLELLSNGAALSPLPDGSAAIDEAIGRSDARLCASDATPGAVAAADEALYRRLHHGAQRLLDASPANALRVAFLASAFPDARFVFVFREPHGAAASRVAEDELPPEKAAAEWIDTMAILLDDLEQLPPERLHVIRLERFAAQTAGELARLASFLELTISGQVGTITISDAPDPGTLAPLLRPASALVQRARRLAGRSLAAGAPAPAAAAAAAETPPVSGADAFRSTATPSFAQILRDLRSTLVVTTYQSARVILIRCTSDGSLNTHLRQLPRPMGVAVRPDGLAIGTDREVIEYQRMRLGDEDVFLPRLARITGDISVHELAYVGGRLWGVNTRFSALCTFEGPHSFTPRWKPPFVTELAAEDRCHLNGLAVDGDRIRYVTALGATDSAQAWRANKAAGGVIVDVRSGATVADGLSMPHSPRLHGGELWFLESGRGTLARADPETGRVETIAELPGFTRGLAFAGSLAFIGLSQVRESNTFSGIPLVERLKERLCGIRVVDLRDGRIVAGLDFEGIVHEIFDVHLLPGLPFPDLLERQDPRVAAAFDLPPRRALTSQSNACVDPGSSEMTVNREP